MTSRSLFCKLMKEDLKQRLWTIVLAFAVFLTLPICTALLAGGGSGVSLYYSNSARAVTVLLSSHWWLFTITCVGAVICGLSGFSYLFSKKKVDFFHSLPVKRGMLFAVKFINGILIYLVPYLVSVLLSVLLAAVNEISVKELLGSVGLWMFLHLTGYLLLYVVTILSVMLTGNLGIAAAATAILFGYTALLRSLMGAYAECFFATYTYSGELFSGNAALLKWTSPVYLYIKYLREGYQRWSCYAKVYLLIVLLLGVAVFLYRKRASERAGVALAFPALSAPIRILLAVPAGLGFGLILEQMSGENRLFWMLFGAACGVLLVHILLESFYHYDIKKCLAHKGQLIGTIILTGFIAICYKSDLTGFDRYFPRMEKLEGIGVRVGGIDGYGYQEADPFFATKADDGEAFQVLYTLAEYSKNHATEGTNYYTSLDSQEKTYTGPVEIVYKLKSGRRVYRTYTVDLLGMREELDTLYVKTDYAKTHFSAVLTMTGEELTRILTQAEESEKEYTLSEAEKEELLAALQTDLAARSYSTVLEEIPVTKLRLESRNGYSKYVYIYASFEHTLAFLKAHGLSTERRFTPEEIRKIVVYDYRGTEEGFVIYWKEGAVAEDAFPDTETSTKRTIVTDKELIKQLYSLLVPEDLCWNNRNLMPIETQIECTITVDVDEYGNYEQISYYLQEGADLSFLFEK